MLINEDQRVPDIPNQRIQVSIKCSKRSIISFIALHMNLFEEPSCLHRLHMNSWSKKTPRQYY